MAFSIDALYGGFADALSPEIRRLALDLPYVLELSPRAGVGWNDIFNNRITLEAPALIGEAFDQVDPSLLRDAVFAHALSVIEAFGADRIADGQVRPTPQLLSLLLEHRRARDRLLERVWPGAAKLATAADRETNEAMREERAVLKRVGAVTFEDYRTISLGKQAVAFPASLALASAVGASELQLECVRRTLAGVWLGLQFEDDAADWEDDWRRGTGAWAVSLARRRLESVRQQGTDDRPTEPDLIRRRVFRMRVLHSMLRSARHQYRVARRYAHSLRAQELTRWADGRIARLDQILPLEAQFAGYVVRARKLAPWAAEVLT